MEFNIQTTKRTEDVERRELNSSRGVIMKSLYGYIVMWTSGMNCVFGDS